MAYYVIAYDYKEALDWVQKNKEQLYQDGTMQVGEARYVTNVETLKGMTNPNGIFVGRWYLRKDIEEILEALHYCMVDRHDKTMQLQRVYQIYHDYLNHRNIQRYKQYPSSASQSRD